MCSHDGLLPYSVACVLAGQSGVQAAEVQFECWLQMRGCGQWQQEQAGQLGKDAHAVGIPTACLSSSSLVLSSAAYPV